MFFLIIALACRIYFRLTAFIMIELKSVFKIETVWSVFVNETPCGEQGLRELSASSLYPLTLLCTKPWRAFLLRSCWNVVCFGVIARSSYTSFLGYYSRKWWQRRKEAAWLWQGWKNGLELWKRNITYFKIKCMSVTKKLSRCRWRCVRSLGEWEESCAFV